MHLWIAVNFTSGCLENLGPKTLGQTEHIDGAVDAGLRGLYGIMLIMHRRCRTGEIVDLIHFHIERKGHIVPHDLEA